MAVVVAVGMFIRHIWKNLQFAKAANGVFNDIKTEAAILKEKGITEDPMAVIAPHAAYRFGKQWDQVLDTQAVAEGLDTKQK